MILQTPCPPLHEFLVLGFGHLARFCEVHRAFGGLEGFKGLESVLHLIIPSDIGVKLFAGYGVFEGLKGWKVFGVLAGFGVFGRFKVFGGFRRFGGTSVIHNRI